MKSHSYADLFPLLGAADLARLAEDVREHGLQLPIVMYAGAVLDGRNRWLACEQAGVEPRTVEYEGTDPLGYVISANLQRRHLNESQRAMIAARLANIPKHKHKVNDDSSIELSQTEAAERMNVSVASLKRAKSLLKNNPERAAAVEAGLATLGGLTRLTRNSGGYEWYTPREFIEAAIKVMGSIDLDPASCFMANEVVRAKKFFTKEEDGLSKDWRGKVFMNPPYAAGLIGRFAEKLKVSFKSGAVPEAIVLTDNATETTFFQSLCQMASGMCLPTPRVRFWAPGRVSTSPLQGQAVLYLGTKPAKFAAEFGGFGVCWFRS